MWYYHIKKSKKFRGYSMKKRMGALVSIAVIILAGCGLTENNAISNSNNEQVSLEQMKTGDSMEDAMESNDNTEVAEKEEGGKQSAENTSNSIETENEEELEEYECGLIEEYVAAKEQEVESTISPAEEKEVYEDLGSLPQEIQDILYKNGSFYEVYNQKEYTRLTYDGSHYMTSAPVEVAEWGRHMVFDFDKDGEKELAVMMQESRAICFIEVFDMQEGQVYAYEIPYRGFTHVFTDGAIKGSSGAPCWSYRMLGFDANKMINKVIAYAHNDEYAIMEKQVTEDEMRDYTEGRYFDKELNYFNKEILIPWSTNQLDEILP